MTKSVPDQIREVIIDLTAGSYLQNDEQIIPMNYIDSPLMSKTVDSILKIIEEDVIDPIEKNGHGGGNWRRLVFQARSKLKGEQ